MKAVTVNSYNKDELYQTVVLLFNQISRMAMDKVGGWELSESFTDNENNQFKTTYTNGKWTIQAVSSGDYHTYSYEAEQ